MTQPDNNPFTVIETPSLDQLAENLLNAKAQLAQAQKQVHFDGERRCIYTVKRPKGKKFYHAIQFANGSVVAV